MKKAPKNAEIFECIFCDFKSSKKSDWDRHLLTAKHQNRTKLDKIHAKKRHTYKCSNCDKEYYARSSLWYHSQKCKEPTVAEVFANNNTQQLTEIVVKMIEQNQELTNKIIELSKNGGNGNNNTINSNNKSFNLNLFLNDTCKDAMNISEFVSSIKLNLDDLENTGRRGYIGGISDIFLKNLNNLEQHMRPLHCCDLKREVLYIKDNDEWIKEDYDKPILTKAIKNVANENIKQIKIWREKYPDCVNSDSKKNNLYLKIVSNSMNGLTEEESHKNINKIISNVAKETIIVK